MEYMLMQHRKSKSHKRDDEPMLSHKKLFFMFIMVRGTIKTKENVYLEKVFAVNIMKGQLSL